MPLGFDSLAPQHSTPTVGGDTLRDNSAKNKSVVQFLKLQPNPIRALLALIRGCMANGSHVVRMDPLF